MAITSIDPNDYLFGLMPGQMPSTPISAPTQILPATVPRIPGWGGSGSASAGGGLGALNIGSLALSGLGTIGNLWNMFQAQKLAKQQFNYTKDVTETNLANQIQSYNTQLEDRIRSRSYTEGRPEGYAESYLDEHSLERRRG